MRGKTVRNVDAEVKTWSGDVSDAVMLELAGALARRVRKVDRNHDIPYVAGYSRDGATVFIDRHMPRSFAHSGRRIATDRFLIVHEIVEKALLDQLQLHYLHAHQIALRTEQAFVRACGVNWRAYDRFAKANEKTIGSERLQKVPRTLDLTPYRDEHDFTLLRRMVGSEQ